MQKNDGTLRRFESDRRFAFEPYFSSRRTANTKTYGSQNLQGRNILKITISSETIDVCVNVIRNAEIDIRQFIESIRKSNRDSIEGTTQPDSCFILLNV